MKHTFYVPILKWGSNPDEIYNTQISLDIYTDLIVLYSEYPDCVGHMKLVGKLPTENEYKEKRGLKSGAI